MTGPRSRNLVVRTITWGGVALFWLVLLTLMIGAEVPLVDSILLAVLLAGVPTLSLSQVPLIEDVVIVRLPVYWGSVVTLWLLGSACWLVGTRLEGPMALGLVGVPLLALISWTSGLVAAGVLTIVFFRQLAVWMRLAETPLLRALLPRTKEERRVFMLLSLAAGTSEEIAYRGYAIPVLAALIGVVGAAALTTVVFAMLHAYQGWLGVLRTGVMGGLLAWGFLASGSLWPCMIAHVLIDVLAGVVLGERLLSPQLPTGVLQSEDLMTYED